MLKTYLSGRIHVLSKRYSPWGQTCWLLSTDCTKENEFWHPLCKLLLSSQERAQSFFCTCFIFFARMITFFLFTMSQYMPILIVYRVIQFSKEGNWFYTRFQQIFQKWRQYYFMCFLKFSSLEQLWALKSIACVDNKVVSVSYSFQCVWIDLEWDFEKLTK